MARGYMAMAAIGATNIGSIELFIEPTLRTNNPQKKLLQSEPPEERVYEPEGTGVLLKKGDEIAAFNMGSTVVLVFQAPISESSAHQGSSSEFRFCIKRGDRIRMGEALGRWKDT
ncbi:UNVERIFIED_CONTAM: Phosphatidylserine decarboxylase proenzyme 1, mitochondrial [Sesamum latifolium]|uniref:Phosphatidylserine decarboxylase proenzyme 1, mitochondrial n=1 Tax=Sesamum latifolium TaxID=2727402 RepID=A0AAW2SSB5_9LAMI